jgi:hypothetical protein
MEEKEPIDDLNDIIEKSGVKINSMNQLRSTLNLS